MRKLRRLSAVILSFVIVISLCLPVLADEQPESLADPEAAVSLEEAADEPSAAEAEPAAEAVGAEPSAAEAEPADEDVEAEPADDISLDEEPAADPFNGAIDISEASVTGLKRWYLEEADIQNPETCTIDGKAFEKWEPSVTVTLGGKTLTNGKDYKVINGGSPNVLPIDISIQGIGNYTGAINRQVWCHFAESIHGKNRYYTAMYTAASIYTNYFSDQSEIVVVKGTDYPDALAANAYAGTVKAPILLTKKDSLHPACKEFFSGKFDINPGSSYGPGPISMNKLKRITVIGGDLDGAIKDIKELLPSVKINVIAGKNRYKTAEEVCKAVIAKKQALGEPLDNVFVATGQAPWDALSASTWSYKYHIPVLLAKNGELADSAKTLAGKFEKVLLLGSDSVVKDSAVPAGCAKVRLAGKNRYKTSEQIGQYFLNNYVAGNRQYVLGAVFAHGEKFPDALAGGQIALYITGPVVLLNDKNGAPAFVKTIAPGSKYSSTAPISEFMMIGYVNKEQWKSGYDKLVSVLKQVQ